MKICSIYSFNTANKFLSLIPICAQNGLIEISEFNILDYA